MRPRRESSWVRAIVNRTLVASLIVATAGGCGGGASPKAAPTPVATTPAPTPAPAPSPPPITFYPLKGTFNGTITSGRNFNGVVLADGSLYGVYTAAGNTSLVGGLLQGTATTNNDNTTVTSSNIKDFNAEGLGVRDATLNARYEPSLSFSGTITYAVANNAPLTFSTTTIEVDGASAIATLAGSYSGSFAASPGGRSNFTMTVDAGGNITANTSGGCHISGQFSPLSLTSVFSMTLSFGAAPCTSPTQVTSGAVFYNTSTRILAGGAPSSDRSNAAIFILTKQ